MCLPMRFIVIYFCCQEAVFVCTEPVPQFHLLWVSAMKAMSPSDWCSACSDLTHKIVSTFAFGPCLTPLKTKLILLFCFFFVFFFSTFVGRWRWWFDEIFLCLVFPRNLIIFPGRVTYVSTWLLDGSHQIRILSLKYQVVIIFWKKC